MVPSSVMASARREARRIVLRESDVRSKGMSGVGSSEVLGEMLV